jgi:hypothetical protein
MIRWIATSLCFTAGLIGLLLIAVMVRYGGVTDALRCYQGMVLSASVADADLRPPLAGESLKIPVHLKNLTASSLTVHGAKSHCNGCVVLEGFPITLGPRRTATLPMEIRTDPSEAGKTVVKSIEFFTSPAGAPSVLSVTLNVSEIVASPPVLVPEPEAQMTVSTNREDE